MVCKQADELDRIHAKAYKHLRRHREAEAPSDGESASQVQGAHEGLEARLACQVHTDTTLYIKM
jgi:hypothetical protein